MSATSSSPRIDWSLVRERYVSTHLDGKEFAQAEGLDYSQLRWHVSHEHWRDARKAFREHAFALAMQLALTRRSRDLCPVPDPAAPGATA